MYHPYPENKKDHRYLKNWSPIALLNTDYKTVAKSLAIRMKKVLSELIGPEQSGFLKDRYIGENIRTILDLINYCKTNYVSGALLFLDFEKAFDCLDWEFLHNTLSFLNFSNDFRTWIKILYSNVSSCVSNNGYIAEYFKLSRGVRQGRPPSPYL